MSKYLSERFNFTVDLLLKQLYPAAGNASNLPKVLEEVNTIVARSKPPTTSYVQNIIIGWTNRITHVFLSSVGDQNIKIVIYSVLIASSMTIIYFGSLSSIKSVPSTALPPTKEHTLYDIRDTNLNPLPFLKMKGKESKRHFWCSVQHNEMNEWHALTMPIMSGLCLLTLYYLIKKKLIGFFTEALRYNLVFACFLSCLHCTDNLARNTLRLFNVENLKRYRISVGETDDDDDNYIGMVSNFSYIEQGKNVLGFKDIIEMLDEEGNENLKREYFKEFTRPKDFKCERQTCNIYLDAILLISSLFSVVFCVTFFLTSENWIICDIVSAQLAIWSISQMNLKNLKSAVFILMSLFLYDIYFVFGTNVMVTVSQNLELPVKLLLPTAFNETKKKFEFSLLGLGDIVLPGVFVSLCYKFDIWKWHQENPDQEFHLLNYRHNHGKYFFTSMISYMFSLIVCMTFLTIYKTAQPALLYIVPIMLLSILLVAWFNNDLSSFWNFEYDTIDITEGQGTTENPEKPGHVSKMTYVDYLNNQIDEDSLLEENDQDYTISSSEYSDQEDI